MKINGVFDKRLRHSRDGLNVAGNLRLVGAVNLDEDDTEPHPPPISPNLAEPVDAAVAFNVPKDDPPADEPSRGHS